MSERRILFLDFHGTLGTRPVGWSGTIAEVLGEHYDGMTVTAEQVRPYLHSGFPWQSPEIAHPELDTTDKWWCALGAVLAPVLETFGAPTRDVPALLAAFRSRYIDGRYWQLYDDTLPTLRHLAQQGWQQVVVSNHVPELADIVAHLGLAPYVVGVVSSGLAGYEKPHPGLFAAAFVMLGGRRPDDVVWMVGDSWSADIVGAQGVGLPAVLVRAIHPSARYAIAGLDDLPGFLDARMRDQPGVGPCCAGDA